MSLLKNPPGTKGKEGKEKGGNRSDNFREAGLTKKCVIKEERSDFSSGGKILERRRGGKREAWLRPCALQYLF